MEKYKWMIVLVVVVLLTTMSGITAFASNTGNVAGAVEGTWEAASSRIKMVVNSVVFPTIDLILVVSFLVEVTTAYMDHRKHSQIKQAPVAILFAGLVFGPLAPIYMRQTVGI